MSVMVLLLSLIRGIEGVRDANQLHRITLPFLQTTQHHCSSLFSFLFFFKLILGPASWGSGLQLQHLTHAFSHFSLFCLPSATTISFCVCVCVGCWWVLSHLSPHHSLAQQSTFWASGDSDLLSLLPTFTMWLLFFSSILGCSSNFFFSFLGLGSSASFIISFGLCSNWVLWPICSCQLHPGLIRMLILLPPVSLSASFQASPRSATTASSYLLFRAHFYLLMSPCICSLWATPEPLTLSFRHCVNVLFFPLLCLLCVRRQIQRPSSFSTVIALLTVSH